VLSADQKSYPHTDAANRGANCQDNDVSEGGDEDTSEYKPHAMDPDPGSIEVICASANKRVYCG
jgi:hypothetical protein